MEILRQTIAVPKDIDFSGEIRAVKHLKNCSSGEELVRLVFRVTRRIVPPIMGNGIGAASFDKSIWLHCQGCDGRGNDLLHPEGPGFWRRPTESQTFLRNRLQEQFRLD